MYGATAPSGPWPPSKRASTRPCFQLFSSNLLLLTAVMHPSESRLPDVMIYFFFSSWRYIPQWELYFTAL